MSWQILTLWALILGTMLLGAGITLLIILARGIRHAHEQADFDWSDFWEGEID
jgi:hypothetical protein